MGCKPDLPDEHYQQMDRSAEARRIRKRVLEKEGDPIRPSMLTMAQMELWARCFLTRYPVQYDVTAEDVAELQALETALFGPPDFIGH